MVSTRIVLNAFILRVPAFVVPESSRQFAAARTVQAQKFLEVLTAEAAKGGRDKLMTATSSRPVEHNLHFAWQLEALSLCGV